MIFLREVGPKTEVYCFAAITSNFHFQVMAELDAAVKRLDQSEGGKTAMVEQVCSYADHSKRVQETSSSYMIGLTPKFKTKGLNNDSHDLHFKTKEAAAKRSNNSSCCFAMLFWVWTSCIVPYQCDSLHNWNRSVSVYPYKDLAM